MNISGSDCQVECYGYDALLRTYKQQISEFQKKTMIVIISHPATGAVLVYMTMRSSELSYKDCIGEKNVVVNFGGRWTQ